MNSVALDVGAIKGTDRSFLRLSGIGRPHDVAEMCHGILALENRGYDRAARHELHETIVERFVSMHFVESACLRHAQLEATNPTTGPSKFCGLVIWFSKQQGYRA